MNRHEVSRLPVEEVFPAGAGMNRFFPFIRNPVDVFPAGAGMNRRRNNLWGRCRLCSPQARG